MQMIQTLLRPLAVLAFLALPALAAADAIDAFIGTYKGHADFIVDGEEKERDMSVTISATKKGFEVSWTTVTYKSDGRTKEKTYAIEFIDSVRDGIYGSAMKTNVFGKPEPLDPLNGEPFVWARLVGGTLSVYSLFIDEIGGYEMQEYHRSLADDGLDLVFRRLHNGVPQKEIRTVLTRQ